MNQIPPIHHKYQLRRWGRYIEVLAWKENLKEVALEEEALVEMDKIG